MPTTDTVRAIEWRVDHLALLDQRLLPDEERWLRLTTVQEVAAAIRDMVVRGAPAIGITAAFGVVLAAHQHYAQTPGRWRDTIQDDLGLLLDARPTAVNLRWSVERMTGLLTDISTDPTQILLAEAQRIHAEDIAANLHMGELGSRLIAPGSGVLTHCNAGSLATGGYGTALGVIRSAWSEQCIDRVYADETRPWLQGSRLTAWELLRDGIPVQLVVEGAASALMAGGHIDWVIVGADRIAANGDIANKVGTCNLAIIARHFGVRTMVVAPLSTIDMACPSGKDIPIEMRAADEVLGFAGRSVAAQGATAWNPVFDITPAALVDVIVTERGVIQDPVKEKLIKLMR
jgi:methylthioribose-1-phosphate isomerase